MEMEDQPQERASDLKALAEAKFGKETLSDAERLLLDKIPSGEWAICGPNRDKADSNNDPKDADNWGPKRQIRAELIAWLCMDREVRKGVHWRGIQVYGADITGPLDLPFVNIPFQLALRHCRLKAAINLRSAEVSQLDLQGGLVYGISADGVIVKNNVFFRNGFAAVGEVRILGAQIGGDLDCSGGTFTNPPKKDTAGSGVALRADRINVKGSFFLRQCRVSGGVRFIGAQIGGDLECDAGSFTNPPQKDKVGNLSLPGSGTALHADRINVKGAVFLRGGFTASGEVRLLGAQIGGDLEGNGGSFTNPAKKEFSGGGTSLNAQRMVVRNAVFLRTGFSADGAVNLYGAKIGGPFDCRNGNFQKATLNLTTASAGSLDDSGLNDVPADSAADSGPTIWPQRGELLLDSFVYSRISSKGRIDVTRRLDWLGLQPSAPFRQQPYLQLAKVLKDSGDSDGALRVREKMEDLRRSGEGHGPFARLWGWILKGLIGYGYHPGRAVWWILLLSVLGWIVYCTSHHAGAMVPTDKDACKEFKTGRLLPPHYPAFSPLIYSVENSLPLVKLGQADKWQPDPEPGCSSSTSFLSCFTTLPRFVLLFLRLQILLGWLLATFFVAGVSGIVHKE